MKKLANTIKVIFGILLLPLLMGSTAMVDPTRPPGFTATHAAAAKEGPLTLTAVFIYPNYQIAIINGQTAMIGDHIDEFTITSITPFTVELVGPRNNKEILPLVTPLKQER